MQQGGVPLSQSKFYSPAFNSAIFDGPFRIYFAKPHESEALKVYFKMQEMLEHKFEFAKDLFKILGLNIYIMIYPDADTFDMSFEVEPFYGGLALEMHENEFVIGIKNFEMSEVEYKKLFERVQIIIDDWTEMSPPVIETQRAAEFL